MRKTMLPEHLGVIYSITTTFDGGEQEVEVGFSCIPEFFEDSIWGLVEFSQAKAEEKLSPSLESALRMVFHLRELDENMELQVHKILYSDMIGRVQFD